MVGREGIGALIAFSKLCKVPLARFRLPCGEPCAVSGRDCCWLLLATTEIDFIPLATMNAELRRSRRDSKTVMYVRLFGDVGASPCTCTRGRKQLRGWKLWPQVGDRRMPIERSRWDRSRRSGCRKLIDAVLVFSCTCGDPGGVVRVRPPSSVSTRVPYNPAGSSCCEAFLFNVCEVRLSRRLTIGQKKLTSMGGHVSSRLATPALVRREAVTIPPLSLFSRSAGDVA